ncbi:MAG TPA: alanine--tRNA ligase, partial [Firmicutes bacterium]|nr:alanine--tRNA ligase [Bacillota bacterium]
PEDVPSKLLEITNDLKETQKKAQQLADRLAAKEVDELIKGVIRENGISILSAQVQADSIEQLRFMADQLKNKLGSGIIVLGTAVNGKVQLVAAVTGDLVEKGFHAGKIIREVATITGGSGGGRPDMAQAGGKDSSKLKEALHKVKEIMR